ncbi:MAG TPA: AI-2E family transporter [Roseococcus sp.]|jgi:predicted PurR-regulated permease PerM|nr:AI-2E family transporter [Roseococcus sp.]
MSDFRRAYHSIRPAGAPEGGTNLAFTALLVMAVLYFARELLVPLALAVLLSFVLAPIVRTLRRMGAPRVLAVLAAVLAAVAIILALGLVMARQLSELAGDIPFYQFELTRKLASINASGGVIERVQEMLQGLAAGAERAAPEPPPIPAADQVRPLPVQVHPPPPRAFEVLRTVVEPLLYPLATFGIVIVFVIFVLLYREDLRDRVIRLVGAHDLQRTMAAMDDAAYRLSRFFLAQVAMNSIYGMVIALALFFIGVPQPILWGILAGLMRFVPFVGTIIAVAFPLLLSLAVEPGWTTPVLVLLLFAVGEGAMGQVFEPLIFGRSTGLSPIAVIAAATFWTWLWGPVGLVMSVPLTVCLVVLGRHVERFEFLEVALGDRPPLEPPETFYQRALGDDPDALAEQADVALRECRLSRYFDTVALPGLALAQADAQRGRLGERQLDGMRARLASLLEDLEEDVEHDVAPVAKGEAVAARAVPPSSAGPILCVGGRGPFDMAAAAMLAQVLRKRGLDAGAAPAEMLRGDATPVEDLARFRQAWLCTVEGMGSTAAARSILRRVKRRLPGVEVNALVIGEEGRLAEALRQEGVESITHSIEATATQACEGGGAEEDA